MACCMRHSSVIDRFGIQLVRFIEISSQNIEKMVFGLAFIPTPHSVTNECPCLWDSWCVWPLALRWDAWEAFTCTWSLRDKLRLSSTEIGWIDRERRKKDKNIGTLMIWGTSGTFNRFMENAMESCQCFWPLYFLRRGHQNSCLFPLEERKANENIWGNQYSRRMTTWQSRLYPRRHPRRQP